MLLMKLCKSAPVAILILWATTGWAQNMQPRVKVDFLQPVIVNSETLPAGHYVFQQIRTRTGAPIFRVVTPQGKNVTLTSIAITTRVPQHDSESYPATAQNTEVVLEKIGGKYYLHRIWIKGRLRGWEFEIPDKVKSQAAEMNEESWPAFYEDSDATTSQVNQSSASNQIASVTGCLERKYSPLRYYIETPGGTQTSVLPADYLRSEMATQSSHKVRLIGEWSNGQQAENAHPNANATFGTKDVNNTAPDPSTPSFHADRIDVISESCSS